MRFTEAGLPSALAAESALEETLELLAHFAHADPLPFRVPGRRCLGGLVEIGGPFPALRRLLGGGSGKLCHVEVAVEMNSDLVADAPSDGAGHGERLAQLQHRFDALRHFGLALNHGAGRRDVADPDPGPLAV